MNNIPQEYKINETINHKEYLINGKISKWEGKQSKCYFYTYFVILKIKNLCLLGKTPEMRLI